MGKTGGVMMMKFLKRMRERREQKAKENSDYMLLSIAMISHHVGNLKDHEPVSWGYARACGYSDPDLLSTVCNHDLAKLTPLHGKAIHEMYMRRPELSAMNFDEQVTTLPERLRNWVVTGITTGENTEKERVK
jgi:hypothetical protein